MIKTDFLIIGSGIAGLSFALKASKIGQVALITKAGISDTATSRAQGGIASVMSKKDTFDSHIKDTLIAGAGLCDEKAVSEMVCQAPQIINELSALGANFTKNNLEDCGYDLGLEGAHSWRRIIHAGDMTGKEIQETLQKAIKNNANICVYENHIAIDLILDDKKICRGAFVLDKIKNEIEAFEAKVVVLAAGGIGKTYLYTTNPDIATGDAIAMAYRAGADIANMEFVQFHPTCLYNHVEKSFLISEAVRGEGAILRLKNGQTFMEKYHPLKELAPRDIVSRAIASELEKSHDDFVYLDITAKDKDFIVKHFPGIYKNCLKHNIDITKDMIPVTPAAHFICGGVKINEQGQTTIPHLFAIGETACSDVHGANRLASNSLLEGAFYAQKVFNSCQSLLKEPLPNFDASCKNFERTESNAGFDFTKNWKTLRTLAWTNLGITRSNEKLKQALKQILDMKTEIDKAFKQTAISPDSIEMRNIICIAMLIAYSSLARHESRGAHFNIDYPHTLKEAKDTVINKANYE